jgi:imidazolonepropionase-like amidohydrolase
LGIVGELRHVAMSFPKIAPAEILKMATIDGAEALGLDREAGSLAIGKRADLLAVPCDAQTSDPYEAILNSRSQAYRVWISGHESPRAMPSHSSGPLPSMGRVREG